MIQCVAVGVRVAAIVASILLPLTQAEAHGGKLQRELAPAGPYLVSVWTQPDPARVGAVDLSTAILRSDTRAPVPDAAMRVTAQESTSSRAVAGRGLPAAGGFFDQLVPPLYHANIEIPTAGRWHATVSIAGAAGRGDVDFDLDVVPPVTIPWELIAASGSVSILVFVAWVAIKKNGRRRRAGSSARHDTQSPAFVNADSDGAAENGGMP